jgi:hypothetical protein
VRLHVLQANALYGRHRRQCADLVDDEILDLARRCLHLAPPEPREVGKTGVRADGDAVLLRQRHRGTHHAWIAGVKSARHVRGGHVRQQDRISANRVSTERLADVGVQIDARASVRSQDRQVCNFCHVIAG